MCRTEAGFDETLKFESRRVKIESTASGGAAAAPPGGPGQSAAQAAPRQVNDPYNEFAVRITTKNLRQ